MQLDYKTFICVFEIIRVNQKQRLIRDCRYNNSYFEVIADEFQGDSSGRFIYAIYRK